MRRRLLLLAPLGAAALAGAGFLAMLRRMRTGRFDPRGVPTMLLGKPVPIFALPGFALPGFASAGFASVDLAGADLAGGRPILLNFFASWCAPCVAENPRLMALHEAGIPLWGIAYKDRPDATAAFLGRHGNPFTRIARDDAGLTAIDFGVTGVPETFLIDASGVVRWHLSGPLTQEAADEAASMLRQYA